MPSNAVTFEDRLTAMTSEELLDNFSAAVNAMAKDTSYGEDYDKASDAKSLIQAELLKRLA